MSVKIFCDACGSEVRGGRFPFEVRCHIGDKTHRNYIDWETKEFCNGRMDEYDLCLTCYNRVNEAAFAKFEELGGKKKQ